MRRFELSDASSNKFWEIEQDGLDRPTNIRSRRWIPSRWAYLRAGARSSRPRVSPPLIRSWPANWFATSNPYGH